MLGVFELKTPKLKGKFNTLSIRYFCEDRGINISEFEQLFAKDNIFAFIDLVYFACKAYYDLKDEPFDFNKAKFTALFDEISEKELSGIMQKFSEAKLFGQSLSSQKESKVEPIKKKVRA